MLKLKKMFVELADDFTNRPERKGVSHPYMKRWRVWINGAFVGQIYRGNNKKFTYSLVISFIRDTASYKLEGEKMMFQRDSHHPGRIEKEFDTLKEAALDLKDGLTKNLLHLISELPNGDLPF
jgi:hypothetical protein